MTRLVIVGGGQIGEALLAGAGMDDPPLVIEPREDRAAELRAARGVAVVAPSDAAAVDGLAKADVVVLAVKPADVPGAAAYLAPLLGTDAVVVSVAAGIPIGLLEDALPAGTPVVRAMPNTPVLVRSGVTAVSGGTHATASHLDLARGVLAGVGDVVTVPEHQLDAVTAVSGSGPAYFYYVVEALVDAAVAEGLPRELARRLVVGTAAGAAAMLRETGEHPVVLREAVSSPGGTTVAAVGVLEARAVRGAVLEAVRAATRRAGELATAPTKGVPA